MSRATRSGCSPSRSRTRYKEVRDSTILSTSTAGMLVASGTTQAVSSLELMNVGARSSADTSWLNDESDKPTTARRPRRYLSGMLKTPRGLVGDTTSLTHYVSGKVIMPSRFRCQCRILGQSYLKSSNRVFQLPLERRAQKRGQPPAIHVFIRRFAGGVVAARQDRNFVVNAVTDELVDRLP
jgi:hypothetical protein